jgi:Mg2+ and Co2+ transporter CorA
MPPTRSTEGSASRTPARRSERSTGKPADGDATGASPRARSLPAQVYDANGSDREVDLAVEGLPKLTKAVLLWLELNGDEADVETAGELLNLPDELVRQLRSADLQPTLADYEDCLHVRVVDLAVAETLVPVAVDAVAGQNWLLTIHRGAGERSESFGAAFKGETELGRLDSLSFLAAFLETQVGSYFAAILAIEEQIDALDANVLRSKLADGENALARLVGLRAQLALVRRNLVQHRDAYSTLGDPALTRLGSEDSAGRFQTLLGRLRAGGGRSGVRAPDGRRLL